MPTPTQQRRARDAERRAERNARMPADKHGTPAGYHYWGCRLRCCAEPEQYRRERYPNR